jgi:hypothetical protein
VASIPAEQIATAVLAMPAFLPAMVCSGYLVAWVANFNRFRERTLVERIFWSLPLSLAVSTSAVALLGRLSLNAAVLFLWVCAALCLVSFVWEQIRLRQQGKCMSIGLQPIGGAALGLALLWTVVVVLSLVDFESNHQLFMSVPMLDQSFRVNWTESILRTGIPPANPLYWYKQAAPMRNYYFWYALCAVVAKMAHLPARAVLTAGCVWAGFALAALNGLCLKYFLEVGHRLRRQFMNSVGLLMVTGLDLCVIFWDALFAHLPLSPNPEGWSKNPIISWFDTLLWSPHHIASLVCCVFAFLLAWMGRKERLGHSYTSVLFIGLALASGFGLSIYVTFAFFLVMVPWAIWQVTIERSGRPVILLAAGGVVAAVLLIPYLWDLTHSSTGMAGGGSTFEFSVREMIPADVVWTSSLFQNLGASHLQVALTFAKLLLLLPGYALELGVYLAVLLIYLPPCWRGRRRLTHAERSLVFIAIATIPLITFLRSSVISINDFGMRSALLLQFPLLLLGSELITAWKMPGNQILAQTDGSSLTHGTPIWVRQIAAIALGFGVGGTIYQALMFRFALPLAAAAEHSRHDPAVNGLAHNAYISAIGYSQLSAAIPRDAIVQFNPHVPTIFWESPDLLGVGHQVAISTDRGMCGSELGGDPSGCPEMSSSIDALFKGASTDQAQTTCAQFGIQYLIVRASDPAWKDLHGWVWMLNPVVSDEEFRALDCRLQKQIR